MSYSGLIFSFYRLSYSGMIISSAYNYAIRFAIAISFLEAGEAMLEDVGAEATATYPVVASVPALW